MTNKRASERYRQREREREKERERERERKRVRASKGIKRHYTTIIIIIIMLAYFYCAIYTRMKANKSSTKCDRRSHYKKKVTGHRQA